MTVCRKVTRTELLYILFTLTQFGFATMERFVVGHGYTTQCVNWTWHVLNRNN